MRYFMRDTPLWQMERQMMIPPNFSPRGHGLYRPGYRYKPQDVACRYCTNYDRKHPCPLNQCICLEERIEAGALDLSKFVHDCFCSELDVRLQRRLREYLSRHNVCRFLNDTHWQRWKHWRDRYYRMSNRNKAALFLLTAYEDIWRRVVWQFDISGFDFQSVRLSGIQTELYGVYQAAKDIATGSHNITAADLADPDLVTEEAFQLIISALLLAKYGDAIMEL